MRAAGLPELVTERLDDYEALALRLASEPELLGAFRSRLARDRQSSPLFNTGRFCRHLEGAYSTMWERWHRGEPKQAFDVSASDEAGSMSPAG